MNDNEIIILNRDEAEQLAGRTISDDEWEAIRTELMNADSMWEVIDECIKYTIEEVIL